MRAIAVLLGAAAGCEARPDTEAAFLADGPIDGPCFGPEHDHYEVSPSLPTTISDALGVKANDSLCELAGLVTVLEQDVALGAVSLAPGGGFTYTPGALAQLWCTDDFSYRLVHAASGTVSFEAEVTLELARGCGRHVWRAYDMAPYIYLGCPEPGPQPWRDMPSFTVQPGETSVVVELASGVPLAVQVIDAPANGRVYTSSEGFAFVPAAAGASRDTVGLRVGHGACSYELSAELVTGP